MELSWAQSTDDFDAQANIRYDVYVDGRFEDVVFGSGGPRVIYGTVFGENVIEASRPTPLAIPRRRAPSRYSYNPKS